MLVWDIYISATYPDMVKSVPTPYLVRIKVPLLGVDTEQVRGWCGADQAASVYFILRSA